MKTGKGTGVIILVASLLFAVTFMDTWMVFDQTRTQTKETGIYQLETISGKLESTINDAEKLTMETAIAAQALMGDKEALTEFINAKKAAILAQDTGAFNVYMAGSQWSIIPDFDMPEDYVATQRSWYLGAKKNGGKTYVTPPYQDAMTGDICYTVSVMLNDGDTVFSIDYTMENIQSHIEQMYETGSHNAVIVTDEGIIAGCSDQTMIGKSLIHSLPDYAGIFSLAKNKNEVVTARIKARLLYENLFATKSGNGWYLIISEDDWELYKASYIQLIVTILLSLALFVIIILLYLLTLKSQKRTEKALESKEEFLNNISGELHKPLSKILAASGREGIKDVEDIDVTMAKIHAEGERLSEMIGQMFSYSSLKKTQVQDGRRTKAAKSMNRHFRTWIILLLLIVMAVSLYVNMSATYRWGNVQMQRSAEDYEFSLAEWINTQKSILDMFASVISTNPEMLEDYEGTVAYLDRITKQYPEISASYMSNPNLNPTVYMNTGWKPEKDWHVEERQWYIDTLEAKDGWSISAPYYDEQTGGYCVTFSERVYDAKTGEFLGNFGIDFFMDKLVDILGGSYSNTGYAFLVDPEGYVINHPYGAYQMSRDKKTNISELTYGSLRVDGKSIILIKDYDGQIRILIAMRNVDSNFIVYVVASAWMIYGKIFIYGAVCLIVFFISLVLIYRVLTNLIRWQDETNEKMKAAADLAIAAGKAKSQFLAQMSHEIRTPINAVLGMNEMILRETKDKGILDYAESIQSAGKTLLSIINSILDFSKIEDGKMEILPVKYELASLIRNLVNSISERAKSKNLELEVNVDENLPSELLGDDVRIEQVLMNLLTNAVKYTEHGKITLNIREARRNADVVVLDMEVMDTGIGIRKEDMGKLFESFERLEEKRNRNIEGTGLGMSIVTKLLKMMESELHVESVYGEGSKFSFRIKQEIVNDAPMGDPLVKSEKVKDNGSEEEHLSAPWAKVLVVDDNAMNLKVAKNLMKLFSITPDMASSGEEAIGMISKNRYDIVFLDHMMPRMDGLETLEKLNEGKLISEDLPVIALTANAVVGAKEYYLKAGFRDYLSKPIDLENLEQILKKYLPVLDSLPEDSIMEYPAQEETDEEASNKTVRDTQEILLELDRLSVSTETGLAYCAGDEEFLIEMLKDFATAYPEKSAAIEASRKNGNWKDYRTYVHALKSTAKTVGILNLSEEARLLEEAAKNEDIAYIELHHKDMMENYRRLAEAIGSLVKDH